MKRKLEEHDDTISRVSTDNEGLNNILPEISSNEDLISKFVNLVKTIPLKEKNFQTWFYSISSMLMNMFALLCKNGTTQRILRITELEPYFNDECRGSSCVHPDDTAHCNEVQRTFNQWYFHRPGKLRTSGYKAISYLGLDLCFGNSFAFGILIRAVEDVQSGDYFYGPSNLLTKCVFPSFNIEYGSPREIYLNKMQQIEKESIFGNSLLKLVPYHFKKENVIFAPRIGLNERKKYSKKPYRFMIKLSQQHLKRKEIEEAIKTYHQIIDKK